MSGSPAERATGGWLRDHTLPFRTAYDPPTAGRWPWSGMGTVTLDGKVMGVFGVHLDLGAVPPEFREHVIRAATELRLDASPSWLEWDATIRRVNAEIDRVVLPASEFSYGATGLTLGLAAAREPWTPFVFRTLPLTPPRIRLADHFGVRRAARESHAW